MRAIIDIAADTPAAEAEKKLKSFVLLATGLGLSARLETGEEPGDRYLNMGAAEEWSGIKSATLRMWMRDGRLTGFKVGSIWLVKKSHLERFIKLRRVQADSRRVRAAERKAKRLRGRGLSGGGN